MRIFIAAIAALALTASAQATVIDSPELPTRFVNALPDVCFSITRGRPPMEIGGGVPILESAPLVPETVKEHFPRITSWYRLKSQPENIFVGTGDRPGACHLILANTTQTTAVQKAVMAVVSVTGGEVLSASAPDAAITDMLYATPTPDGYMLVSLQAPREMLRNGEGDQGAVHVKLFSKTEFEMLVRRPKVQSVPTQP